MAAFGKSESRGGIFEYYHQQGKPEDRKAIISTEPIPETVLTQNVIAAIRSGSQIDCHAKQYPEVRQALVAASEIWSGKKDAARSLLARNEVLWLDALFGG